MSEIKDGGPAFPSGYEVPEYHGMTLRDYFAAKAMQALISSPNLGVFEDGVIAESAYKISGAMLKARGQE